MDASYGKNVAQFCYGDPHVRSSIFVLLTQPLAKITACTPRPGHTTPLAGHLTNGNAYTTQSVLGCLGSYSTAVGDCSASGKITRAKKIVKRVP